MGCSRFSSEDGYRVGWNDELSDLDKDFISRLYPR
jgi:hypothetical protein